MARFIAVGFDSDATAEKFKTMIKEAGHRIRFAVTSSENKTQIHNLPVRTTHVADPRPSEARAYEYPAVIVEFRNDKDAAAYAATLLELMCDGRPEFDYYTIAGVKMGKK